MSSLVGKTLGRYQLLEQIGQGAFAAVYKAYQPELDRYAAVKVFSAIHPNDPASLKRFELEMPWIARLKHPHVVPIYNFGVQDGMAYIIMESVSGGTLAKRLKSDQPFPLSKAIDLILQACQALEYLQQQHIIHRDVNPKNMLLRSEDFLLLDARGNRESDGGSFIGTPQYTAPEQATGQYPLDWRSDLYSLGVVFYQAVTGRVPFGSPGDAPVTIIIKHIQEPPPLPSLFVPGLPPKVEQVILKALEKDPAQRYQSATELIAVLTTI
jgi:eukaryotic-like serine/threonine-protein kinase